MTGPRQTSRLSANQMAITVMLVYGFTNGEMARQLGISPRTIEDYRRRVYAKFGVQNAVGLVRKIYAGEGG